MEAGVTRSVSASLDCFDAIVELPFGYVGVRTNADKIEQISFLGANARRKPTANAVAQQAVDQLVAYCNNSGARIDLPLSIGGNEFQRCVWSEISEIPSGATRTYGDIARSLNSDPRAVGQACGDNRLPLAIPCHRVVAATGIGGFAHRRGGEYERIKRWLLMHEAGAELRLT